MLRRHTTELWSTSVLVNTLRLQSGVSLCPNMLQYAQADNITLKPIYLTTDSHLISEYGRRPLRSSTEDTNSSTNPQQIWW